MSEPSGSGIMQPGNRADRRVYAICSGISVVWLLAGVAYFLVTPSSFIRMWPHELGSLLSGWIAPLAALWLFAAVMLQRAQLEAQRHQLEQTREHLERSIAQLEQTSLSSQLNRLEERMMHATLRFARTSGGNSLYLAQQGQRERLGQIVGPYRRYAELFKGNELSLVLDRLGRGLTQLVARMNEEWMLHGEIESIEELGTELNSLIRIVTEILELLPRLGCGAVPQLPAESELSTFRECAHKAFAMIDLMLHDLRTFDVPDECASTD